MDTAIYTKSCQTALGDPYTARIVQICAAYEANMAKVSHTVQSRYASDALTLLGRLVREARIERRMTADELAARAGVSRNLIGRIERGEPGTSIGAVFETAAILGIPLFETDHVSLAAHLGDADRRLRLMPKAVHRRTLKVRDAF